MRRASHPIEHYELELHADGLGRWRPVQRLWHGGAAVVAFASPELAQVYAGRLRGRTARIVRVRPDGRREVVGRGET